MAAVVVGPSIAAHELPRANGLKVDPDGGVVLRTTRGLVFGDLQSRDFRLQCLEYSRLGETETPTLASDGATVRVGGLDGLLAFDRAGCSVPLDAGGIGLAVTDLSFVESHGWVLVTAGAGQPNDAWTSSDGRSWTALSLPLDGVFLTRMRALSEGWLSSGIRIDIATGGPVHFLRGWQPDGSFVETPVDLGPDGYRVLVTDTTTSTGLDGPDRALVLVDRYAESASPDQIWAWQAGELTLLLEAPDIQDARFGPDGSALVATLTGLLQVQTDGATVERVPRIAIAALDVADGRIFISTDYSIVGYALAEVTDTGVNPLLRYEGIRGPTECADAPAMCDADWADWALEIPVDTAPVAPDAGEPDAGTGVSASVDNAGGCAANPGPSAHPIWLVFASLGLLFGRRRPGSC
jgi:hypothetical protein